MKYKQQIIIYFLLLFLSGSYISQAKSQDSITLQQYESLKNELGFDKTKKTLSPRDFGINQSKKPEGNIDFLGDLIKIFGYLTLAVLVIFLLYLIVKELRFKQNIKSTNIDLDNIEDIKNVDFETMLANTLTARDFRLAIRIKFLMVIKSLTENQILDWKPYKTNRTYAGEIKKVDYKADFKRLTNVFEHIWYGVSSIEENQYLLHVPYFDSFLKQIRDEAN